MSELLHTKNIDIDLNSRLYLYEHMTIVDITIFIFFFSSSKLILIDLFIGTNEKLIIKLKSSLTK